MTDTELKRRKAICEAWPYYHDGTRETLQEAVRDMGIYQSGVELTQQEIDDMVAFLLTLTGEYNGVLLNNTNVPGEVEHDEHDHHHDH